MKMSNRKEYKADAAERVAGPVSKKRRMDIVRTLLIAILLLALPFKTFAQWGFDVAIVEALYSFLFLIFIVFIIKLAVIII